MNYLSIILFSLPSSLFFMNFTMERPHKRFFDQTNISKEILAPKKQFYLDRSLLQHGAYVATVKNKSGKDLRIATVPLQANMIQPAKDHAFGRSNDEDHIQFVTDEKKAQNMTTVNKDENLETNRLFFSPKTVSNDISAAEGFCLLVEAKEEPKTRKLLWILRSIDNKEKTCQVMSYFHHEPDKTSYNKGIAKYYDNSKVVTLINLVVNDAQLHDIKAFTTTFAIS